MASDANGERENMFLLEVLVDYVTIHNSRLNLDPQTLQNLGEACVMFQFLNYPPLVVCQEDFGKRTSHYGATTDIKFNSGKSCLFSFRSRHMPIPQTFQIQVYVIRKVISRNGGTGKKTLATTNIDLGEDFAAIMRISRISVIDSQTPLFQTKGDTYALQSLDGTVVGEIKVFLRLSCFGQYIVTQFHQGEKETYLFKGTERSAISKTPGDKTKKPIPQVDISRPCPPPRMHIPSVTEDRRSQTGSVRRSETTTRPTLPADKPRESEFYDRERRSKDVLPRDTIREVMCPTEPGWEVERQLRDTLLTQFPPGKQPPQRKEPLPAADVEGDYKEISAEVKGHTIRIRVPRRKKDDKQPGVCKYDALGPVCKYAPKLNVCDCNYPIPPELIPRCPVPPTRCPVPPTNCQCR